MARTPGPSASARGDQLRLSLTLAWSISTGGPSGAPVTSTARRAAPEVTNMRHGDPRARRPASGIGAPGPRDGDRGARRSGDDGDRGPAGRGWARCTV